ncbi:hypothetical protein BROUX41_002532 [Berkeleyomyces rouxiae]
MTSLPQFAPFPRRKVRDAIPASEWAAALVAWATLTNAVLALNDDELSTYLGTAGATSAVTFLRDAYAEVAANSPHILSTSTTEAALFLRLLRSLLLRLLSRSQLAGLSGWDLLADVSRADSVNAGDVLALAWATHGSRIEASLATLKKSLIRLLDANLGSDLKAVGQTLSRLNHLLRVTSKAAMYFAAGDDFLDGIVGCYKVMNPPLRKVLLATGYLCLHGLLDNSDPKLGMLADKLYSLKVAADTHKAGPISERDSYVVELVSATPLLSQIKRSADFSSAPGATALESRVSALKAYQRLGGAVRPPRLQRKKKLDKGKQAASIDVDEGGVEFHAHKLSKIAEVQDLFPELGSAFVCKCLDEYNENVEQVVAHLLDDSLPSHLSKLDKSEQLPNNAFVKTNFEMAPHATPPPPSPPQAVLPTRRNVYDDDDLDRLTLSVSKNLHFGKANPGQTADSILHDKTTAPSKAAILSALAAFDADDDERDDTYDADDVGAAVDQANDEADGAGLKNTNDEVLWRAYTNNPSIFERTNDVRATADRAKLREETGMTDEALEGWMIILNRSPQLKRRLEARFSTFDGTQTKLTSSRWTRPTDELDSESGPGPSDAGQGRGGHRGRGRGGGRGGRGRGGGSVAGPTDDAGTQKERKRKEAGKSSRANHNRRDAHAKKMARGG